MRIAASRTIWATRWATRRVFAVAGSSGRAELNACYDGQSPRHPVFVALAETVREFEIPKHEFADLLTAFRQDQTRQPLRNFQRSAGLLPEFGESGWPSGAVSLRISRFRAAAAFRLHLHRAATGKFLARRERGLRQRTNLSSPRRSAPLRRERRDDPRRRKHGRVSRDDAFEVERAREWFAQGLPLIAKVERALATDIELFSRGGQEILNAIERQQYAVLGRRPVISKARKLSLVARAALGKLGRQPGIAK